MAESEIPADIRATAKAVRDKLCIDCECTFDRGCGCLDAIAEAMLAERMKERERMTALFNQERSSG
jgi:hypothetical protein